LLRSLFWGKWDNERSSQKNPTRVSKTSKNITTSTYLYPRSDEKQSSQSPGNWDLDRRDL
jgi:hypothetical protein